LATLCQEFLIDDCPIVITVSIGISIYPLHGENGETLLKQADIAMYQAKELGRNRYEFSESLALKNEKIIT
jgi:diguanylate cyclase (GGDEF)-like protein